MNKVWLPKFGDSPQIARRCRPEKKVLCTIYLDSKGIVLQKPRMAKKSITREYYRDCVLSELNKYYKKARQTSGMRVIKLLHDNAPAYKSKLVQELHSKESIHTLSHPPYSPDLAPCGFVSVSTFTERPARTQMHLSFSPRIRRFPVSRPHPKRGL